MKLTKDMIDQILANLTEKGKRLPAIVMLLACHSEEIGKVFLKHGVTHVICVKKIFPILDTSCNLFYDQFLRLIFESNLNYNPCMAYKEAIKNITEKARFKLLHNCNEQICNYELICTEDHVIALKSIKIRDKTNFSKH